VGIFAQIKVQNGKWAEKAFYTRTVLRLGLLQGFGAARVVFWGKARRDGAALHENKSPRGVKRGALKYQSARRGAKRLKIGHKQA
jgi:hypothetical protein